MEHKFKFELETTDEKEAREISYFIDYLNEKYRIKMPEENSHSQEIIKVNPSSDTVSDSCLKDGSANDTKTPDTNIKQLTKSEILKDYEK